MSQLLPATNEKIKNYQLMLQFDNVTNAGT